MRIKLLEAELTLVYRGNTEKTDSVACRVHILPFKISKNFTTQTLSLQLEDSCSFYLGRYLGG